MPTSDKVEADADQRHTEIQDLKHSSYNRFRSKDKDVIEFQEKLHSLHEYEKKPFMLDFLSKQVQTNDWNTLNTPELEVYFENNPLVSLSDICLKKKKRKTIKESLSELVDINELKKTRILNTVKPLSNKDEVIVLEAKNIKTEKLNNKLMLPKTNTEINIIEISLCSSDSDCEQSYAKKTINKTTNVPQVESIANNVNIFTSQVSETQANFIDNELEMNIIPNENNIEALLDHFSDESVAKTNNNESISFLADESGELVSNFQKSSVMTNIENTLVSKVPETSNANASSNDHFEFFNIKLQEIFQNKINTLKSSDLVKIEMSKSKLEALVLNINQQVMKFTNPKGDSYTKYYNKMCKIKKMIDSEFNRNGRFYYKILSGILTPENLAKMTDEELKIENDNENGLINLEDELNSVNGIYNLDNSDIQMISEEEVPLSILSKNIKDKAKEQIKTQKSNNLNNHDQSTSSNLTTLTSSPQTTDTHPITSKESLKQVKPKTMFLADSSDEEDDEANEYSDQASQEPDMDDEHNILKAKDTYLWCVCENSSSHKNCEMCEKCKHWYHKECTLKLFTKMTTVIEDDEFYCFACNKDLNLMKKYEIALTIRKHPNIELVKSLNNQKNSGHSSSSESEQNSSDNECIGIGKKTKRNQLLDSSSNSSSSTSLATIESVKSIISSSSSDSDNEIRSKNSINKKSFKSTPRIEISDLNININKNGKNHANSLKSANQLEKTKEITKLNDKERIEKVKKKIKTVKQTKLIVPSDLQKKKHQQNSDFTSKLSSNQNVSPTASSNTKTINLNSKKKEADTASKIQQVSKDRQLINELFSKSNLTIVNKNTTSSASKPNPTINKINNTNNNSNKPIIQPLKNPPTILKANSSVSISSQVNKTKTLTTSSTAPSLTSQYKPPFQQVADTFEACRPIFKKSLIEKLKHKMDKNPKSPVLLQPELVILVDRIEAEFYKHFRNNLKNYKIQKNKILHNISDPKNDTFYLKILTHQKGYMPEDLPKISNDEMLSDEAKEERKKERQNDLEQREKFSDELNLKKASIVNFKNSERGLPEPYADEIKELLQKTKYSETGINNPNNQNLDTETGNLNKSPNLMSNVSPSSLISSQEKNLVISPLLTSKSIDFFTPAVSVLAESYEKPFSLESTDILKNNSKETTHQHNNHIFDINCKICTGETLVQNNIAEKISVSSLMSSTTSLVTDKVTTSAKNSSTELSHSNLCESNNSNLHSPTLLLNKNFNFRLNDSITKKSELGGLIQNNGQIKSANNEIGEKNSFINIEKPQQNSVAKDKNVTSSIQKNSLTFNFGSSNSIEKPQTTEPKNNAENNQINAIKNAQSLFPLSPTFFDDLNHSPRSLTGSLNNESTISTLNNPNESKEKVRVTLEEWSGSIDLPNSSSCSVKGYPLCGKNMEFYNELKERFFNKKLSQLLIDVNNSEHVNENLKNQKSIFEYLKQICSRKELIFIRFEADKLGKSKINLIGGNNWQVFDSSTVYNCLFNNSKSLAVKQIFYKIKLPNEVVDFLEDFYLFPLTAKKDTNNSNQNLTPDGYFASNHHIKVVRKADYIMGVTIRKERMSPHSQINNLKRKELSTENNLDEDSSKRSKMSNIIAETSSSQSSNSNSNISLHQSSSVTSFKENTSQVRDPRLIQRFQNQIFLKSTSMPDINIKEIPLTSLPPSAVITPTPELAKEMTVNVELNSESNDSLSTQIINTNIDPVTSLNEKTSENFTQENMDEQANDKKDSYEKLIEALNLIIVIDDKEETARKEQLEGVKNSQLLDQITDEEREKIFISYIDKLPDFVFIVLDSSKNEKFKTESIDKWRTYLSKRTVILPKELPPAEKWLGTSKEQVLERIKIHKSGLNLSLENENWKKTKRSFELVDPSVEQTNGGMFKNTFHSVCD